MWFKFKNVATIIIETFHLLLITILLGNPFNVKQIDDIVVMASTAKLTLATIIANSGDGLKQHHASHFPHQHQQQHHPQQRYTAIAAAATGTTTTSISTVASLSTPATPASSLNASLFVLQASSVNNLYNSTFAQVIDRNGKYNGKQIYYDAISISRFIHLNRAKIFV